MRMISGIILTFILLFILNPAIAAENKILINIPSRTLEVIQDGKVIKSYPVGVGRPGFPTPIGQFKVISKIVNPGWENPYKPAGESKIRPGRGNPLGTRWIGFHLNNQGEYGMHGTNSPSSVGKYSSHGCVRMKINDAENLFNKVDIGTPVKVSYYTHKVFIKNNKIMVRKYPSRYKRKVNPKKIIEEQLDMLGSKYNIDQKNIEKAARLSNGYSLTIGEVLHTDGRPDLDYYVTNLLTSFTWFNH